MQFSASALKAGPPAFQAESKRFQTLQMPIFGLAVLSVLFNPLFAFLNANAIAIAPLHVMAAEGILLFAGAGILLISGLRDADLPNILLALCFLILALLLSMRETGSCSTRGVRYNGIPPQRTTEPLYVTVSGSAFATMPEA